MISTQGGVWGCLIRLNDAKVPEILAIQEKTGVTAGWKDFWKVPGGLVDSGEDCTSQKQSNEKFLNRQGFDLTFIRSLQFVNATIFVEITNREIGGMGKYMTKK